MEEGIKGLVIELKKHKLRRKKFAFAVWFFPAFLTPSFLRSKRLITDDYKCLR